MSILVVIARKASASGLLGGALAQFLASPTDLIKVQMQMEGRRLLEGKPPRYGSFIHVLSSSNIIKRIAPLIIILIIMGLKSVSASKDVIGDLTIFSSDTNFCSVVALFFNICLCVISPGVTPPRQRSRVRAKV